MQYGKSGQGEGPCLGRSALLALLRQSRRNNKSRSALFAEPVPLPRLHVEMEVVLVRLVGGGAERRAEHLAGLVVHGFDEDALPLGKRRLVRPILGRGLWRCRVFGQGGGHGRWGGLERRGFNRNRGDKRVVLGDRGSNSAAMLSAGGTLATTPAALGGVNSSGGFGAANGLALILKITALSRVAVGSEVGAVAFAIPSEWIASPTRRDFPSARERALTPTASTRRGAASRRAR